MFDGAKISAAFRDKVVDYSKGVTNSKRKFHDAYYNEMAAYVISRQLNLNIVPPTVIREIGITRSGINAGEPRPGTLQLWVTKTVSEMEFLNKKMEYKNLASNLDQQQQKAEIRAFDCIIGNVDRHPGNFLIDLNPRLIPDGKGGFLPEQFVGKYWAIDHSRAFHHRRRVKERGTDFSRRCGVLPEASLMSLEFIAALTEWNDNDWRLKEVIAGLNAAGLSPRQRHTLNLKSLSKRAKELFEHFKHQQADAGGLSDKEFYTQGLWHKIQ